MSDWFERLTGFRLNRIAKNLGVHHSAVSRVLEAVAVRNERSLAPIPFT